MEVVCCRHCHDNKQHGGLGAQVKYQVVGSLPSNMMSPSPASGKRSKEVRKPWGKAWTRTRVGKKSEAVDLHTFHVFFGTVEANGKLKQHSTGSIVYNPGKRSYVCWSFLVNQTWQLVSLCRPFFSDRRFDQAPGRKKWWAASVGLSTVLTRMSAVSALEKWRGSKALLLVPTFAL